MGLQTATSDHGIFDRAEVEKFSRVAAGWWDENGPFAPLHRLNPARLTFIRDQAVPHFGLDAMSLHLFEGLAILDVGCGGGLVTEPMARLGGTVMGLDADAEGISVAMAHACEHGLAIEYRQGLTGDLIAEGSTFDMVLALEIIEHVPDPAGFVADLRRLVRPGGLLVMSTLNRTPFSFMGAIAGAEYLLRWVPRGTHDWKKFLKPSELARLLRQAGFVIGETTGLAYAPITQSFSLSRDMGINYMMAGR